MKKTLCVILLTLTMLLLPACKDDLRYIDETVTDVVTTAPGGYEYTPSDDRLTALNAVMISDPQVYDGYLYYVGKTFERVNLATGQMTPLCADPLCEHNDESCPFYGITFNSNLRVVDGRVYFDVSELERDGEEVKFRSRYKCYDIADGRLKIISDTEPRGGDLRELYVGSYRYFIDDVYNEADDSWSSRICRMNLSSGDPVKTKLYSADGIPSGRVAFALDGRIYYYTETALCSLTYELTDFCEVMSNCSMTIAVTDGEYIYYGVPVSDTLYGTNYALSALHRVMPDGSQDTDLGIITGLGSWKLTDSYIYYLEFDRTVVGKNRVSGYGGKDVELYFGKIHRAAHDGSGDTVVYTFSGEEAGVRFISWTIDGNYVYARYTDYTDKNGDGYVTDDEVYGASITNDTPIHMIRIDLTGGKAHYYYENE